MHGDIGEQRLPPEGEDAADQRQGKEAGACFLPGPLASEIPLRRAAAIGGVDGKRGKLRHDPSPQRRRSEEHTSELQSLMRISYAVFCLTHKNNHITIIKKY